MQALIPLMTLCLLGAGTRKTPLRSTDVLRKFSVECGAKQPQLLTTTSFRKHIAVISQMINLKENELDTLAGFLGHNIKVHRDFYRLPEDTLQVVTNYLIIQGVNCFCCILEHCFDL